MMDLQTGLVCAALFVLSAGVLLLISVFGMRSKSYEEALAEQRTLSAGLLGISRPKPKDKKQKKANKKVKEKLVSSKTASDNFELQSGDSLDTFEDNRKVRSEHQEQKQHVEFEEPIIVITTDEVSSKSVSSNNGGRRSTKRNVRSILVNREPSPVNPSALRDFSGDSPVVLNHFEHIHPKDECELLKSHSKEDLRENSQKNNKKKGKNSSNETEVKEIKTGKVKIPAHAKSSEDVPAKFESKKSFETNKKPETINKKQESSKRIDSKTRKNESEPLIKNEPNKKINALSAKNQDINRVLVTEKIEENKKTANSVKIIPAVKTIDNKNVSIKNGDIPKPTVTLLGVNAKNVPAKMNDSDTPKNNVISKKNDISKNITNKNIENPKMSLNKNDHTKNNVKNDESKSVPIKNSENRTSEFSKNANLKNGEVLKPSNNTKKNDETLKNLSNKNYDATKIQANNKNGELKNSTPTKIKQSIEVQSSVENGVVRVQQVAEQQYNAPPLLMQNNNSKKKKRNELSQLQQMSANEGVNVSLLVPLVRKAELSRSEVQILIDLLLNKQHEGPVITAEWSESRSDPVQKLKKQLAEREKILEAEQEAHAGVAQKLREVRSELNARLQALKQAEEAAAQAHAEKQAFAARLQHAQEHIQAEKQHLQQQLQQLQAKISAERMSNKQFQEEHGALQAQRQQLEVAIAHLQENEAALKGQIQAMHNELQEQQNMVAALSIELRAARTEADMLRSSSDQIQDLVRQLDESRRVCNDLEQRFTSSQRVSQATNDELRKSDEARAQAQIEIQRLKVELAAAQTHAKTQQDDSEKLIAQVKAELSTVQASANGAAEGDKVEILNLQNEISSLRAELKSNKEELEAHRNKNNESINRVRSDEQDRNRNFLERLFPDIKVPHSNNLPYDEYLTEFETAVHSYREIKEKETKLATELAVKETKVASEQMIEEAIRAATEAESNKKLERQNSEESNVINERLIAENASLNEKLTVVTADVQKLQEHVTRYKTIIDDTEGMLNKLQLHIENEEGNWKRQLETKNAEITSLKMHLSEIQSNEISELKEKLSEEERRNQALSTECETLRVQILSNNSSTTMSHIEQLKNDKSRIAEELSHDRTRCRELSQECAELHQIQSQIQQLKDQPENHTLTSNGSEAIDSPTVSEDTK